jgi:ankyrin repeat protein
LGLLHLAVSRGDIAAIEALAKAGADPNAETEDGETPLHVAASKGDATAIEILLKAGANSKAKNEDGQAPADLLEDPDLKELFV